MTITSLAVTLIENETNNCNKFQGMENLLNPNIEYTDPDTLQFCLPLSDTKFWYCQVNDLQDCLLPKSSSIQCFIFQHFTGEPKALLKMSSLVHEVREFITNHQLWFSDEFDVTDIPPEEQLELLKSYGYSWDDFDSDKDRNQIICEIYFEEQFADFSIDYLYLNAIKNK